MPGKWEWMHHQKEWSNLNYTNANAALSILTTSILALASETF
jgi:hypothetical protein